jgi:signal peptidase II
MKTKSKARYVLLLTLALVIVIVDQITKQLAYEHLGGQSALEVVPVFSLVLVFNEGAAFGFLNDAGGWQHWLFITLAIVFSMVLLVWIWREQGRNGFLAIGLALILGGAIGNVIDRINAGHVIDFLLLHYKDWYFPAFNIADISITFGAIVLIVDSLLLQKNE